VRTFFPKDVQKVDASSHCDGAEYAIGIGTEMWADGPVSVLKIQMAYDGQVAGRKAPSFPVLDVRHSGSRFRSCPDFDEVATQIEKLIDPLRHWLITWDRPFGGNDVSGLIGEAIKDAYNLGDEDIYRPCHQVRTVQIQASGTAAEVAALICSKLRELNAPGGIRLYVARVADDAEAST
jgi:hypothetical protein